MPATPGRSRRSGGPRARRRERCRPAGPSSRFHELWSSRRPRPVGPRRVRPGGRRTVRSGGPGADRASAGRPGCERRRDPPRRRRDPPRRRRDPPGRRRDRRRTASSSLAREGPAHGRPGPALRWHRPGGREIPRPSRGSPGPSNLPDGNRGSPARTGSGGPRWGGRPGWTLRRRTGQVELLPGRRKACVGRARRRAGGRLRRPQSGPGGHSSAAPAVHGWPHS